MPAKKTKTFEENLGRLEEIVALLERADAPLQESLALFEEGTKLVKDCSATLEKAQQQVVKLQKGPDGEPVETPFAVEE